MSRRRLSRAFVLAFCILARTAMAGDVLPLKVTDAWVRAVPGSLTDTAAFMILENTGDVPLKLTGAKTELATMAMAMETTHKVVQGVDVQGMAAVDSIEVPPHGRQILKPGAII